MLNSQNRINTIPVVHVFGFPPSSLLRSFDYPPVITTETAIRFVVKLADGNQPQPIY